MAKKNSESKLDAAYALLALCSQDVDDTTLLTLEQASDNDRTAARQKQIVHEQTAFESSATSMMTDSTGSNSVTSNGSKLLTQSSQTTGGSGVIKYAPAQPATFAIKSRAFPQTPTLSHAISTSALSWTPYIPPRITSTVTTPISSHTVSLPTLRDTLTLHSTNLSERTKTAQLPSRWNVSQDTIDRINAIATTASTPSPLVVAKKSSAPKAIKRVNSFCAKPAKRKQTEAANVIPPAVSVNKDQEPKNTSKRKMEFDLYMEKLITSQLNDNPIKDPSAVAISAPISMQNSALLKSNVFYQTANNCIASKSRPDTCKSAIASIAMPQCNVTRLQAAPAIFPSVSQLTEQAKCSESKDASSCDILSILTKNTLEYEVNQKLINESRAKSAQGVPFVSQLENLVEQLVDFCSTPGPSTQISTQSRTTSTCTFASNAHVPLCTTNSITSHVLTNAQSFQTNWNTLSPSPLSLAKSSPAVTKRTSNSAESFNPISVVPHKGLASQIFATKSAPSFPTIRKHGSGSKATKCSSARTSNISFLRNILDDKVNQEIVSSVGDSSIEPEVTRMVNPNLRAPRTINRIVLPIKVNSATSPANQDGSDSNEMDYDSMPVKDFVAQLKLPSLHIETNLNQNLNQVCSTMDTRQSGVGPLIITLPRMTTSSPLSSHSGHTNDQTSNPSHTKVTLPCEGLAGRIVYLQPRATATKDIAPIGKVLDVPLRTDICPPLTQQQLTNDEALSTMPGRTIYLKPRHNTAINIASIKKQVTTKVIVDSADQQMESESSSQSEPDTCEPLDLSFKRSQNEEPLNLSRDFS